MTGDEVRSSFLQFFQERGHLPMPSASLIPAGDPTLLFTSSGMVPFKPFFMGEQTPPSLRLTSSQKSFRTTDIDEVGDHKHLTFFEMLGNFSIGDYFKDVAIAFAWELVTQVFHLPADRLYVTVHLDDEDAFLIWRDEIGVPVERIYRYGDKDNWWGPAGTEGPTGPCSEIHYDGGADKGCGPMVEPDVLTALQRQERDTGEAQTVPGCHPNCDCERFVELWNLVFMQFYQDPQRNRTPLPAPSVDTGMGLERAAVVLQGKNNIYETDLFAPIIERVCQLTGKPYGVDPEDDYALRVVAEHARAASFLIGDGVVPGNEGRGYVLRRIIRRAIRHGRLLGLDQPFLSQVAEVVLAHFRHVYRELLENHDFILRVIRLEEERFGEAYERGIDIFNGFVRYRASQIQGLEGVLQDTGAIQPQGPLVGRNEGENIGGELAYAAMKRLWDLGPMDNRPEAYREAAGTMAKYITGDETFVLYDTYGFPPELTAEIAREHGLEVDMEGFQQEMEAQRDRARAAQAFTGSMEILSAYENLGVEATRFVGYLTLEQESVVAAILVDGSPVGQATQGQELEIVLQASPMYAEGGGQVGDRGTITGPNGVVRVHDAHSPVAGLIMHRGVVEQGDISLGEPVTAQVDAARRWDAARNHSGTHLLHASLRTVLGHHVRQAGSLVAPERLRFDFSHVSPLSPEEIISVQSLSNERIRDNLLVSSQETTYAEAVRQGALAFFGDKYGDVVRVVSMAAAESPDTGGNAPFDTAQDRPFSLELCGGTHVGATGQVGTLFVLGESSIGGGMRRIEAVTGRAAEELFVEQAARLDALSQKLQTPVPDLEARLESFIQDHEDLKRRLATLERATLRTEAEEILRRVADVDGIKVVAAKTSAANAEAMREMGDFLKAKLSSAVIMLASVVEGNPILVAMVTPDLVERGLHAGNMARDTAKVMGGGGGGRPEMAQAGGRDPSKLDEALNGVTDLVRQSLS
ncbi:MAG: alanine--tRNA ligase [Chloroflexi bacterium]|nr:alanine--tRNA ligase [Chloroflexota bacterium]